MTMINETVDILDTEGRPTGVVRAKRDAHREGLWHRAVHVWIATPDGRLLLQKRAASKKNFPNLWDISVAGHVSAGETPIDTAIRETREEIGITLTEDELRPIGTDVEQWVLDDGRYLDNEFHDVFLVVREIDPGALRIDREELEEVSLVDIDDFKRRVAARDAALVPHWPEYEALLETLVADAGGGSISRDVSNTLEEGRSPDRPRAR